MLQGHVAAPFLLLTYCLLFLLHVPFRSVQPVELHVTRRGGKISAHRRVRAAAA